VVQIGGMCHIRLLAGVGRAGARALVAIVATLTKRVGGGSLTSHCQEKRASRGTAYLSIKMKKAPSHSARSLFT